MIFRFLITFCWDIRMIEFISVLSASTLSAYFKVVSLSYEKFHHKCTAANLLRHPAEQCFSNMHMFPPEVGARLGTYTLRRGPQHLWKILKLCCKTLRLNH